mmetsp:Transcript_1176/g.1442  ORF Transcript_1176/g.1442 Transcript_1176/m.1442 type:complete len:219 (-) Transcript_1176:837-1493(-)
MDSNGKNENEDSSHLFNYIIALAVDDPSCPFLKLIASYCSPMSIYEFCLTCRSLTMDENTVNEDGDILGTQLLRIALDMSFNQTLAKHTAFARSEIDEICRAGDYGGCVITGSSLVKTLYGPESHKNWKSDNPKIAHDFDLDVFCTREKQRQVITKLRAMKLYGYTLYDSEVYALGEQNIQGYHIVTSTKSSYAFYHKKKKKYRRVSTKQYRRPKSAS